MPFEPCSEDVQLAPLPIDGQHRDCNLLLIEDARWETLYQLLMQDFFFFFLGRDRMLTTVSKVPVNPSSFTLPTNENMRMQMSQVHLPFLAGLASGLAAASAATF